MGCRARFIQALTLSSRSLLRQRCMSWSVWLVHYSWGEYCYGWVTIAWRMALSMLRVCARGLSCRTAEARGDSTGAVLGQVVDVHARAVH